VTGAGARLTERARAGILGVALAVAAGGTLDGCAPKVDARFARGAELAETLETGGRYREAANAWLDVSRTAHSRHDRDEALYRAAGAYERASELARSEALLVTLERGRGERAARAAFDRARLVSTGDPGRGQALRLAALRAHPDSGVAPQALRRYLEDVEAEAGAPAALERCTALAKELAATELDEAVRYDCAARSELSGDLATARAGYLATAERHPYPHGALWDDSLAGAARCEERLGRPAAAVALLERMLAEREHSIGIGSYERPRYAEARFHIAELYRDRLGDPSRARQEFRRVLDDHSASLLCDDALFEEARLAARAGDGPAACDAVRLLASRFPESRFVGCSGLVCAGSPEGKRPCPEVVQTSFARRRAPDG
jgi:tetratricopeptide (TPR) repeat protein